MASNVEGDAPPPRDDSRTRRNVAIAVAVVLVVALIWLVVTQLGQDGDRDAGATYPALRVVAAGDIAAASTIDAARQTADLLAGHDLVLTLGDHAYQDGTPYQFETFYDPTWGRFVDITRPTPGNHDYHSDGYFGYFGDVAGDGYYSFERNGWLFLSLNSNCDEEACTASSDQVEWLERTLEDSDARCQLAYFHHPLISIGKHAQSPEVEPFWETLFADDAELVLNGHDHNYQRWSPMTPGLTPRDDGLQQFIVGTGGAGLYPLERDDDRVESSAEVTGVLELDLYPGSYEWRFRSTDGEVVDRGTRSCR